MPSDPPPTSTPTPKPKRPEIDHKPRRRFGCIAIVLSIVCFSSLLALIGIRFLSHMMLSKLSADKITELRQAESRIVRLPAEWHQPIPPLPRHIISFHADFGENITQLINRHNTILEGSYPGINFGSLASGTGMIVPLMATNEMPDGEVNLEDSWASRALFTRYLYSVPSIDDDQRTSYAQLLAELQPVIDSVTSVTKLKDYEMQGETLNLISAQNFAKLMRTKALVELSDGDTSAALQSAILPMNLIKRPAASLVAVHAVSGSIAKTVAEAFWQYALKVNDPQQLKDALQMLTSHRAKITLISGEDLPYLDMVHLLGRFKAFKIPVDQTPQPAARYYRQWVWLQGEDYYRWAVQNLPASDPIHVLAVKQLSAGHASGFGFWGYYGRFINRLISRKLPTDTDSLTMSVTNQLLGFDLITYHMCLIGFPWNVLGSIGTQDSAEETAHAAAVYDLARLRLAQQLALIEGKMDEATSPTASALAVTHYINPMPLDPFTSAPFKVSPQGQFYSVGPDKTDDHAATPYDATTGTTSPGDIYFLPPKDPNEPDPTRSFPAGAI